MERFDIFCLAIASQMLDITGYYEKETAMCYSKILKSRIERVNEEELRSGGTDIRLYMEHLSWHLRFEVASTLLDEKLIAELQSVYDKSMIYNHKSAVMWFGQRFAMFAYRGAEEARYAIDRLHELMNDGYADIQTCFLLRPNLAEYLSLFVREKEFASEMGFLDINFIPLIERIGLVMDVLAEKGILITSENDLQNVGLSSDEEALYEIVEAYRSCIKPETRFSTEAFFSMIEKKGSKIFNQRSEWTREMIEQYHKTDRYLHPAIIDQIKSYLRLCLEKMIESGQGKKRGSEKTLAELYENVVHNQGIGGDEYYLCVRAFREAVKNMAKS